MKSAMVASGFSFWKSAKAFISAFFGSTGPRGFLDGLANSFASRVASVGMVPSLRQLDCAAMMMVRLANFRVSSREMLLQSIVTAVSTFSERASRRVLAVCLVVFSFMLCSSMLWVMCGGCHIWGDGSYRRK